MTTTSQEQTAPQDTKRKAMTPTELAETLGVGRTTAYELLASGRIASVRVGRRWVVPVSAIDAFLAAPVEDGPGAA